MSTTYTDPFSIWTSFYSEVEPKASETMQKWLESDEYATLSGHVLTATLQMEQNFLKTIEQLMKTYNIPTMKDFSRLGELLIQLEGKVDNIEENLFRLQNLAETSTLVRDKLEGIGEQLAEIEKAQQALAATKSEKSGTATVTRRKRTQKTEETSDQSSDQSVDVQQ